MTQDPFGQPAAAVDDDGAEMNIGIHPEVFVTQLQAKFTQIVTQVVTENAELRAALQTVHAEKEQALAKAAALQKVLDKLGGTGGIASMKVNG